MSALAKKAAKKNTTKPTNRSSGKGGKAVKALSREAKVKAKKRPVQAVRAVAKAKASKPAPAARKNTVVKAAASHSSKGSGGNKKAPSVAARKPVASRPDAKGKSKAAKSVAAKKPLASQLAKSKALELREKERAKKQHEREKLAKQREQEKLRRQKEADRLGKQKEAERLKKQKEAERQKKLKEQEAAKVARAKEEEKKKKLQEREAQRQAELRAKEEERRRQLQEREDAKKAKEDERLRQKAEREAEREQARKQKEEERAKRDAEREAYRKAKEAERERIRATKEAQKRALEGRIAEQTRNANKLGGGRSSTTRFYSPRAIPNQSGTTRRVTDIANASANAAPNLEPAPAVFDPAAVTASLDAEETPRVQPPPERPLPTAESVEERYRVIEERLKETPPDFKHNYQEALDMSWIYHDSALEGVVYTFQELRAAIDQGAAAIADSSLQPVVEEVRRHKAAIDLVRELGEKKRAPITVDVIRKIYLTLHPEEGDLKTVKYRRDIPQHRLYFHEYAHPDKIQHKVRQIVDWLNGPEPKKLKSPIRVASRAHYELLRVFPFQTDSGKVARLFMNLLLIRSGHPPAIVHSTERQRYYEALRGALPTLIQMVTESILNGLVSIEKLLDDRDIKVRSTATSNGSST